MKKLLLAVLFSSSLFSITAGAYGHNDNSASGGYSAGKPRIYTVMETNTLSDHILVIVDGFITRQIENDVYELQDDTGTIRVKIENNQWNGLVITPETKIRIEGRMDNHLIQHEINADRIYLAK